MHERWIKKLNLTEADVLQAAIAQVESMRFRTSSSVILSVPKRLPRKRKKALKKCGKDWRLIDYDL